MSVNRGIAYPNRLKKRPANRLIALAFLFLHEIYLGHGLRPLIQ